MEHKRTDNNDVLLVIEPKAKIAARLINFVTAKDFLLNSHINWLDKNIADAVRSSSGVWVDLFGYASRKGPPVLNHDLSFRRCESVKRWVNEYAENINFQIELALGESQSGGNEQNNDKFWRAVEIYVYAFKPPPKEVTTGSTLFKIRVVGGVSISPPSAKGGQGDGYFFQIVDEKEKKTAFFRYSGLGLAIPTIIPGLPMSVTKEGPFSNFRTSRPVTLDLFEGKAQLYQDPGFTAGSISKGGTLRLTIDSEKILVAGSAVIPSTIPIDGGWGIQTPSAGSATTGMMKMQGKTMIFTP